MEITISLVGSFKQFSPEPLQLHFDTSPTVEQMTACLISKLGQSFGNTLMDPILHSPFPRALILVSGKEISALEGLDTRLSDSDQVVILPVSHGG